MRTLENKEIESVSGAWGPAGYAVGSLIMGWAGGHILDSALYGIENHFNNMAPILNDAYTIEFNKQFQKTGWLGHYD